MDQDANEWSKLIAAQDAFVARLITEKHQLGTEIEKGGPAHGSGNADLELVKEQLESLKAYTEYLEERMNQYAGSPEDYSIKIKTLEEESFNAKHRVNVLETALEGQGRAVPQHTPVVRASPATVSSHRQQQSKNSAAPIILVLIDGSSAPFADSLLSQGKTGGTQAASQVRWEVEKDLRAFNVDIDEDDEDSSPPEVVTYVFYDQDALAKVLLQSQVITNPKTLRDFALAFNSGPTNQMIDIGETSTGTKIATLLKLLVPARSVKRCYVAGVHPSTIFNLVPELEYNEYDVEKQKSALGKLTHEKIIIINHREWEGDREDLAAYCWRIAVFARFFSPNSGLGGDWGFKASGTGTYKADGAIHPVAVDPKATAAAHMKGQGSWNTSSNGGGGSSKDNEWKTAGGKKFYRKLEVDKSKDFLNQNPPFCFWHYLSINGCTSRGDCGRSHKYQLTPEELDELAAAVKTVDCKERRETGDCTWEKRKGSSCMFGHISKPKRPKQHN
ncbi:hypothetical protein T439DRAFT_327445 [Meredithblackwellia eburnea MCA 4105]